jgi:hypothetical protein
MEVLRRGDGGNYFMVCMESELSAFSFTHPLCGSQHIK